VPADYERVAPVVDEWWGGREMAAMLPRLFFVHFAGTTFVAEDGQRLAGFLAGFLSQSYPREAYIHFVGVSPEHRSLGVGRMLYERFFAAAREAGRSTVRAVTSPATPAPSHSTASSASRSSGSPRTTTGGAATACSS
jgi:ribosomal protein S18 acetylase RimI-like enzyme